MFLDVSGCFWMFLDVSGCFWMFLDVSGCSWMFLDVSGDCSSLKALSQSLEKIGSKLHLALGQPEEVRPKVPRCAKLLGALWCSQSTF